MGGWRGESRRHQHLPDHIHSRRVGHHLPYGDRVVLAERRLTVLPRLFQDRRLPVFGVVVGDVELPVSSDGESAAALVSTGRWAGWWASRDLSEELGPR